MAESAASARRRRPRPGKRGTLRDEQRRQTRERLADAALELFEEVGYAAATTDAIARRAGANRATFYLHYAGKADVVLELMERVHEEVVGIFATAGALEDPTREEVRAWLAGALGFWDRNRALVDANHQAMTVEPRGATRWWAGFEQMVDAMPRLWEGLEGEERELERARVLTALVGLERLCWFLVLGQAPLDRERALDVLAEEWHALLHRPQRKETRP
jgi:AcrR family transcriptional regulator